MSDQPKPSDNMAWTCYTKDETEIWFCGPNSIVFDGPDREANARKFMCVDELVDVLKAFVGPMSVEPDGRTVMRAHAILAKIEGGKK